MTTNRFLESAVIAVWKKLILKLGNEKAFCKKHGLCTVDLLEQNKKLKRQGLCCY